MKKSGRRAAQRQGVPQEGQTAWEEPGGQGSWRMSARAEQQGTWPELYKGTRSVSCAVFTNPGSKTHTFNKT